MECSLEADNPKPLRFAVGGVIFAGHFDGAFHRLGTGIGEEHQIGERRRAQPFSKPLSLGDAVKIGHMPERFSLFSERLDQMRVGMPQRVDGDTSGEIEIALTVSGCEPSALSTLKGEVHARIGREQMRRHDTMNPC